MTKVTLRKKLIVSSLLAPIVSSRDVIDILETAVKKTDKKSVDLDFSNVKFISRSSAHALLQMKERLHTKKEISFVNANEEVTNMLRAVAANRAAPKQKPDFDPKEIDIDSLFRGALA
ncbi:MAG: STAS domain-containing protein [Candidatus Pacebacteria bacterium]|nr:STAS domain-containing protein [Candidatus Paceibacterota bacterium]